MQEESSRVNSTWQAQYEMYTYKVNTGDVYRYQLVGLDNIQTNQEAHVQPWTSFVIIIDGQNTSSHWSDVTFTIGRRLRRALDRKVRKLRSMLTADEDITMELDSVVCRLMKLALRTSRGRRNPPPTRWLQCKLLDLLTLTEKTIDRRKKHFIETYPLTAIDYDPDQKAEEYIALEKFKKDETAIKIVDKYRHLVKSPETVHKEVVLLPAHQYTDLGLEDESVTSTELLKDFEYIDKSSPNIDTELIFNETVYETEIIGQDESKYERVRNWIVEDVGVEIVPYPNHSDENDHSTGALDLSPCYGSRIKYKKSSKKLKYDIVTNKENSNHNITKKKVVTNNQLCNYAENIKSKIKSTNTRVDKKSARKKSNYSLLKKNRNKRMSIIKNYEVQSSKKKKRRQCTPSKPIPESIIELCQPDLNGNKYYDNFQLPKCANNNNEINNVPNNISATEESFLIAIVTEDMEETFALRRSIGTDADSIDLYPESLIKCINHEVNEEVWKKYEDTTENTQAQTIFLNDINEPSTSKGIRYLSMDVQCGPDNITQTYGTLSATTSFSKLPIVTENVVEIGDLYKDINNNDKNLGTSLDDNDFVRIIRPKINSVGIWIQDSEPNLSENIAYATDEIMDKTKKQPQIMTSIVQSVAPNETKLLKAISSNMKIEDSGSEFCGSISNLPKSPLNYKEITLPNDEQITLSLSKDIPVLHKLSPIKYMKPKLCCGGVHIHSYKDKHVSEDIVYQGEWQKCKPKSLAKKKSLSSILLKRFVGSDVKRNNVITKNKTQILSSEKKEESNKIKKNAKPLPSGLYKSFQTPKSVKNKTEVNINKTSKTELNNKRKITTKHVIGCALSCKTQKLTYALKKPPVLPIHSVNKDLLPKQRLLAKNYIPHYLRKRSDKMQPLDKNNLNESIDTVKTEHDIKKTIDMLPSERLKTEDRTTEFLKFHPGMDESINYVVFRNEIEKKNSKSNENTAKTRDSNINKSNANHRAQSPDSQNSSTCSSPNSIATIRQVSKKLKNVSMKRTSTSSEKSNINDSGSETSTSTKLKKNTKRGNCHKSVMKQDKRKFDNKENLIDNTINNLNKHIDKVDKTVYKSNQKNVFIAQIKSENQSLQSTITNLSRHKPQYNNLKASSANFDEKTRMESPSVSIKRFSKSENVSNVDNDKNILEKGSFSVKIDLLSEPQLYKPIQEKNQSVESNSGGSIMITSDKNKNNGNDNNNANAMRGLLEEILNLCNDPLPVESNDSKTILFNLKESGTNEERNSSIASFQSVLVNDNTFNSTLNVAVENVLNCTFDTTFEEASVVSLADTYITVTDLDLLSFKSIASGTKLSDNVFESCNFNIPTSKNNSVCEIFERRDQPILQIPGGGLAMQAFSGFSFNGKPLVGDQPDHINLVDSETGSLAVDVARQTTSEELFVSGRSSGSYESCVIDEDAVVPNWLFNIISQQQSAIDGSDSIDLDYQVPIPIEGPMPLDEPALDANGNMMDPGLGAGAGAGDGRGIHSNHSQDSSGRDTSFSSSETSSEQQSEAIIIDPSTFLEQFEGLGERSNVAVLISPTAASEPSGGTVRVHEEHETSSSRSNRADQSRHLLSIGASDVEADVSSLDTDVPDSSDN